MWVFREPCAEAPLPQARTGCRTSTCTKTSRGNLQSQVSNSRVLFCRHASAFAVQCTDLLPAQFAILRRCLARLGKTATSRSLSKPGNPKNNWMTIVRRISVPLQEPIQRQFWQATFEAHLSFDYAVVWAPSKPNNAKSPRHGGQDSV